MINYSFNIYTQLHCLSIIARLEFEPMVDIEFAKRLYTFGIVLGYLLSTDVDAQSYFLLSHFKIA